MSIKRFVNDLEGGPLVEAAILLPLLLTFLLGAVDFLLAYSQWATVAKAIEVGARIAAVSDPVADGLIDFPTQAVSSTVLLGNAMPDFQVTCDGSTGQCTCTRGTCPGLGTNINATAMNKIISGRDRTNATVACGDATSYYNTGMCDIFPSIRSANLKIVYEQTGLGYAGRTAGPVPTITVSIQNVPFQFFFLRGFLGFANLTMPPLTTTITGEALSSAAQ